MNSRRFIVILYAVLFAGLGAGALALFNDASKEYEQLRQAGAANRRRLAEAQARLAVQEKILERLRTDPTYVEKVLRRHGYAKPGDYIFRFED